MDPGPIDARDEPAHGHGQLAAWVVQLLEQAAEHAQTRDGALLHELAAAAAAAGLRICWEPALLGGGTVELLVNDPRAPSGVGVAVVLAGHGATDALRAWLRRLAVHREITEIVLATTRRRHVALHAAIRQVPVHVVVLEAAAVEAGPRVGTGEG